VRHAHLGESEAGITKHRRDRHVKHIALEEAFWYDKLATDRTPLSRVPVRPEVVAGWQRRLGDFAECRNRPLTPRSGHRV
jgi:hypothetical protein